MFSGLYDALNQRASSQSEAYSPNGTPRSSLSANPLSPGSPGASHNADGNTGAPTYSTYQRRAKPSLEDRLRASLAAKEQKRVVQEKEKGGLPNLPPMDERPETGSGEVVSKARGDIDAAGIPLPVSPPTQALDPAPSLQEMTMVLSPQVPEPPVFPEHRQIEPTPTAIPVTQPPAQAPIQATNSAADPLSPRLPVQPPSAESNNVQELVLPSPRLPSASGYPDPLTGSLMKLEKEQQAAAAKATTRSARSPPPPSSPPPTSPSKPQYATSPHTSPSKHHVPSRSFSSNRSSLVDGEPFARLETSQEIKSRTSLDQIPRASTGSTIPSTGGLIEWLRIDGVQDAQELKEWIEAMKRKAEITQEEINRLNRKLTQQDSRIEELRDMHRLESSSQSELIDHLRQKVVDAEAQASAAQSSLQTERALLAAERSTRESLIAAERAKHSTELTDLDVLRAKLKDAEADVEKSKGVAKEEEEKRTKAISLLKTVRTKLVKAEKERDDLQLQMNEAKNVEGKGEEEVRSLKNEVEGFKNEVERVRRESEREIERVREEAKWEVEKRRRQLENDMASSRDAMERDLLARRGEWEIEGIATKTAHQKEVTNLNARIASLTTSLSQLGSEKERLFTDLQFRQSELESARIQVESIQAQLVESNYQLRERDEQLSMVQVELTEARRAPATHASGNRMDRAILSAGPSGTEVARLLKEAESRSESRVSELRARLKTLESERAEQEENWSRSLAARGEEIERLRGLLAFQEKEGTKVGDYKALREKQVTELEGRLEALEREKKEEVNKHKEILGMVEGLKERLESRDFELGELGRRLDAANSLVDELRGKELQLKNSNKTLREELRKVQSSAALLERQRNPGIGYWASHSRPSINGAGSTELHGPASSSPDLTRIRSPGTPTGATTPTSAAAATATNGGKAASSTGSARSSMEVGGSVQGEEEVNLEYLRNVILQFLENEKMRPNLVRVLSVILHFTPQETRRLIAKV